MCVCESKDSIVSVCERIVVFCVRVSRGDYCVCMSVVLCVCERERVGLLFDCVCERNCEDSIFLCVGGY